jgi:hypothetical protein
MGRTERIIITILGIPFFLGGAVIFMFGMGGLLKSDQAKEWKKVPVEIKLLRKRVRKGSKGPQYYIETRFTYSHEGKKYTGRKFSFAFGSDNVTDHDALIKEVMARKPPYGFVNPDDPSEAVLMPVVSPMALFIIPFGILFMLAGASFLFAGVAGAAAARNAAALYKASREIRANRLKSCLPLAIVPGVVCFIMLFLSGFVLIRFMDPMDVFYVLCAALAAAFLIGLVITFIIRSGTKAVLKVKTPPGETRPFAVQVTFDTADPFQSTGSGEDKAYVEVKHVQRARRKSSTGSVRKLAAFGMKRIGQRRDVMEFEMDPESCKIFEPGEGAKVPKFMQGLVEKMKERMMSDPEYIAIIDFAGRISAALLGGPESAPAAAEVREGLAGKRRNIKTALILERGKKKTTFVFPPEIWAH